MKTQHEVLMADPEFRRLLAIETLTAEAAEAVAKLMADQNISKADLARRLGKSRAWVTQLLSGRTNMTVATLAEVAFALDAEVTLRTQPPRWKAAGKPSSATRQPVVYRMDSVTMEPAASSDVVFHLEDERIRPASEEPAPDRRDTSSEYAA